jgi:S-formylglutathione hydrolase
MSELKLLSEHACFGGMQGFYEHASGAIGLPMKFGVYRPPQAAQGPVPVLFWLAGLTCTEETFAIKAGAQQHAAKHGLMLVTPDTSPRHTGFAEADANWDLGHGAGFYLDAIVAPWSRHFRMETYVTQELRELVLAKFPARADRVGIFGHSMGGHGALTLALRHPELYLSVSAFAPVAAPSNCPWGIKAFGAYLGFDRNLCATAGHLVGRRCCLGTLRAISAVAAACSSTAVAIEPAMALISPIVFSIRTTAATEIPVALRT